MKSHRALASYFVWIGLVTATLSVAAQVGGCAEQKETTPVPKRVVDLSPTFRPSSPTELLGHVIPQAFGMPSETSFEHHFQTEPLYLETSTITLMDHVGPHVDAPIHMIEGGKTVEEMPLDQLIGPARILDFRAKPADAPLLPGDFEELGIEPGDIVVVFVGYEPPSSQDGIPSYPYLSGEAAEYLASIPVRAFSSDMPSTGSLRRYGSLMADNPTSEHVFPEHIAFLRQGIPLIEGLVNVEELVDEESVVFVGFPLKLEGASGGLMRAAALVY
jgi:kynurenine formamidase